MQQRLLKPQYLTFPELYPEFFGIFSAEDNQYIESQRVLQNKGEVEQNAN